MSRAESNLPALLDGQVPVQERRARVARPVAKGAAWLSAVLMVLAVVLTEPALAGAALGLLGTLLLGWLGAWLVTGHFLRQTRPTDT